MQRRQNSLRHESVSFPCHVHHRGMLEPGYRRTSGSASSASYQSESLPRRRLYNAVDQHRGRYYHLGTGRISGRDLDYAAFCSFSRVGPAGTAGNIAES